MIIGIILVVALVTWAVTAAAQGDDSGPAASALPASTQMGPVELNVADLATMRNFYEDTVGLRVLAESEDSVDLGYDSVLLRLQTVESGSQATSANEAGLYHSAILYVDKESLARTMHRIARAEPYALQESADHLVSLAFYFVDPEGNGLELYVDRPEDEWNWVDSEVEMGSQPLDPNAFIAEHIGSDQSIHLEPGTDAQMGRFSLQLAATITMSRQISGRARVPPSAPTELVSAQSRCRSTRAMNS